MFSFLHLLVTFTLHFLYQMALKGFHHETDSIQNNLFTLLGYKNSMAVACVFILWKK